MKAYLRDHIRDNLKSFLYIIVICMAITFVFAINGQISINYKNELEYASFIGVPATLLIICAYVIPVMEFSIFKKRVNLDCLYALPIKRRELAVVHYITGLLMLVIPYTLSYLLNALLLLRAPEAFDFSPLLPYYFVSLALGISQYSVFVFVFHKANTKGDGIWFIILWSFVLVLVLGALREMDIIDVYQTQFGIPWGLLTELTPGYSYLIEGIPEWSTWSPDEMWENNQIVWFIFWILAGIAATVGFLFDFGKQRTEKTEEISNSIFGYKVLIPVYAIAGMITFYVSDTPVFWLIIEIIAILGYTIYRRGFHYKKSDIIILILLIVFLFI